MNPLSQLPESMDELLNSFLTQAIVGNTTIGFTYYVFWFLVAVSILVFIIFRFVKKQATSLAPQGTFVNGVEFIIEYVRDDVIKGILGDTWEKHFPFLITLFLVILANNVVGLIPGCHPGTGTIGVTGALATCSFAYFVGVGIKREGVFGYIKSLAPKDVHPIMAFMVWLIEVFSTFLRLVTLAVRLFCNMFAGHVVMGTFAILASLFFGPVLQQVTAANIGLASTSIFWTMLLLAIYLVEILVAFIQSYIFTLLSAVYIQLVESE